MQEIKEWHNVNRAIFENEIVPLNQPAVMRSLAGDWPVVKSSNNSYASFADYLKQFDNQTPQYTIVGEPEIEGYFFYRDDLQGVNFQRSKSSISGALDQLLMRVDANNPHGIAVQAAQIREALPGFHAANNMPLLDTEVAPTLWLSNRAMVAPHYDVHDNVACVIAGRRIFTLFPPEQIANLYVGPRLDAPGGVPISLVDINKPDFDKYPRYTKAEAAAQSAELAPGDAIFIPAPWWHGVQSLEPVNALVNYWWGGITDSNISPGNTLLHGMLSIAKLDSAHRQAWRAFFDYFVFKTEADPTAHLPADVKDIVTEMTEEQRQAVYAYLKQDFETDQ